MSYKTYAKDGVDFIETNNHKALRLDGVAQDERIRKYMQEHGCNYEDAAIVILDADAKTKRELARQDSSKYTVFGSTYDVDGQDDEEKIQKYMQEHGCDLLTATAAILDR